MPDIGSLAPDRLQANVGVGVFIYRPLAFCHDIVQLKAAGAGVGAVLSR